MTLTVEELREHVGPGPSDDVLERLLDAAYSAIEARYGAEAYDGEVSELLMPSGSLVFLSRAATSLVSVKEGDTVLDEETDCALRPGGKILRRLDANSDPTPWTAGYVDVTYVAVSDADERDRVAIALVRQDLSHQPGLIGRSISSWQEQYANNSVWNYAKERDAILNSLRPTIHAVW